MRINDMALNKRFGSGFVINRKKWTRDYLLLHFRTPATVNLNGVEVYAEAGSMIVFHVGTPQHYYANQNTYADDYIHFFIDDDYTYLEDLNIPFNEVIKLPKVKIFSRLFNDLHNEYISNHKNKASSIDLLMKLLFNKISEFLDSDAESNNYYAYYELLHKLRTRIYANPERNWTVLEMAKSCNLSSSYLQTLYKQAFNITCINDVINSKVQYAKSLLSNSDYTIKEIAVLCGYHNIEYFMRQFKKSTGFTPSQFRNEFELLSKVE